MLSVFDIASIIKHAQEMILITEALEREGYGPTQATVDEVIRHLWWKKEHFYKELQSSKETLTKVMGVDQWKQMQVGYSHNCAGVQ